MEIDECKLGPGVEVIPASREVTHGLSDQLTLGNALKRRNGNNGISGKDSKLIILAFLHNNLAGKLDILI
jgi:hypothetical protein